MDEVRLERGERKNHGERFTSQGVVLGRKRSAALDDGATGGISAIILRAHSIAAAKVRLQSLQIQDRTRETARGSPKTLFPNQLDHARTLTSSAPAIPRSNRPTRRMRRPYRARTALRSRRRPPIGFPHRTSAKCAVRAVHASPGFPGIPRKKHPCDSAIQVPLSSLTRMRQRKCWSEVQFRYGGFRGTNGQSGDCVLQML